MTLRDLQQKLRDLIKSSAHEIFGVELEQINTDQPPKPELGDFAPSFPSSEPQRALGRSENRQ